jgi:hypothetical protein
VGTSVELPAILDRFREIFVGDFEYRTDANGLPVPVCLSVIELRSGREFLLRRPELLALHRAPFDTNADSLFVAFNASAEHLCFLRLGWLPPTYTYDPYLVTAALTNGSRRWPHRNFRPGLLVALQLFDLEGMESEEKKATIELILSKEDYSEDEWQRIIRYCRSDVIETIALFLVQVEQIDLGTALHWGRYQKAVAPQEQLGLPVDTAQVARLHDNWTALKLDAIRRHGVEHFYDGTRFVEQRLEDLIIHKGWNYDWPKTPTGKFETKLATIGRQAERHPTELQALAQVRGLFTDLRMTHLVNSVGRDGYARCPLRPFHTITGRNQPHARGLSFIPALPAWLHGLLKPPPGFALIDMDWKTQEVGIMAALSGDPNMIADYLNGDCHIAFAIRAALIDNDDDEETREHVRNKQAKPVVLGSNYGMTAYGIRAKTKRSLDWCRHIYRQHRVIYHEFHEWLDSVVAQARFDRHLHSVNGWPLDVHSGTRNGTLLNFPAQSGGADMMRHAAICAVESGIAVCCSVHDSFKVLSPIGDVEQTCKRMDEIMRAAGAAITGSFEVPAETKPRVHAPQRQADVWTPKDRGLRTWVEIQTRLDSGELPVVDNEEPNEDEEETFASKTSETGS